LISHISTRGPVSARMGTRPQTVACTAWTSVIASATALTAMASCKISARIGTASEPMTCASRPAITSLTAPVGNLNDVRGPSRRGGNRHRLQRRRKEGESRKRKRNSEGIHYCLLHVLPSGAGFCSEQEAEAANLSGGSGDYKNGDRCGCKNLGG